eukprot:CAMPEP_0206389284 /NCGR_PEP_ID=MMETSP0294-20121207/17836_1 /ASSEMBLY_ACC=CAM_ASM_000327 /TAXON_ID=39354 /ORGANISM="Heterosigma akashiwo, Strain CCMP2393" /LENGTH=603 /DNA_ID=CAMNT_0053841271 /DNA_START=585 /DNA_END=2395 /DNA_ORIENTATION=+
MGLCKSKSSLATYEDDLSLFSGVNDNIIASLAHRRANILGQRIPTLRHYDAEIETIDDTKNAGDCYPTCKVSGKVSAIPWRSMTAKQCAQWVESGDMLVSEARKIIHQNRLEASSGHELLAEIQKFARTQKVSPKHNRMPTLWPCPSPHKPEAPKITKSPPGSPYFNGRPAAQKRAAAEAKEPPDTHLSPKHKRSGSSMARDSVELILAGAGAADAGAGGASSEATDLVVALVDLPEKNQTGLGAITRVTHLLDERQNLQRAPTPQLRTRWYPPQGRIEPGHVTRVSFSDSIRLSIKGASLAGSFRHTGKEDASLSRPGSPDCSLQSGASTNKSMCTVSSESTEVVFLPPQPTWGREISSMTNHSLHSATSARRLSEISSITNHSAFSDRRLSADAAAGEANPFFRKHETPIVEPTVTNEGKRPSVAPASLLQLLTKKKNKDGAAAAASSAGGQRRPNRAAAALSPQPPGHQQDGGLPAAHLSQQRKGERRRRRRRAAEPAPAGPVPHALPEDHAACAHRGVGVGGARAGRRRRQPPAGAVLAERRADAACPGPGPPAGALVAGPAGAAPAEPASGGRVQALLPAHALRGRGRAPIFALCGIV